MLRMRRTADLLTLAVGALAIVLAGCARTVVSDPLRTDYPATDAGAQLDFWHDLPGRTALTNDEGLHGVVLLFDGADPTESYAERLALLKRRGWVAESFDEPADLAMQRGTLARALVKAMDVRGGVMLALTRGHPRYAARELAALGIMPRGSELMVIDGLDYLGVISKAQDYMAVRAIRAAERESGPGADPGPMPPAEQLDTERPPPRPERGAP